MPNRVSHPRGPQAGVMLAAVRKNLMAHGVILEEHDDLPGCLNNLHGEGVKKNPRETGWITAMVNRVVRFREGIGVRSEGGLGSFVLRLAPRRHGKLLDGELINPVLIGSGWRMVLHPNPGQVMRFTRIRCLRRFGRLFVLRGRRGRTTQYDHERKGNAQRTISHLETPSCASDSLLWTPVMGIPRAQIA